MDELIEGSFDVPSQLDPLHRRPRTLRVGRPGHADAHQFILDVHQLCVVHLFPVVVLGSHGEQRHDRNAQPLFELLGEPERGERLVQGVQGADEQAGLLAGGHENAAALDDAVELLADPPVIAAVSIGERGPVGRVAELANPLEHAAIAFDR